MSYSVPQPRRLSPWGRFANARISGVWRRVISIMALWIGTVSFPQVTQAAPPITAPSLAFDAPMAITIPPHDPDDHHIIGTMLHHGLGKPDPTLPYGCLQKTPLGQKYLLHPKGPYFCQGNTLSLRIGEEQYRVLSCHAAECLAMRTFHGGKELNLGELFRGYWANKRLAYPKIVTIKLAPPQIEVGNH